jgi:hypothetical protein
MAFDRLVELAQPIWESNPIVPTKTRQGEVIEVGE